MHIGRVYGVFRVHMGCVSVYDTYGVRLGYIWSAFRVYLGHLGCTVFDRVRLECVGRLVIDPYFYKSLEVQKKLQKKFECGFIQHVRVSRVF